MSRNFGHAAGTGRLAEKPHDLSTTDGLVRHSQQHGAMQTLAAVAERGVQANAPKQSVEMVTRANGSQYVRRTEHTAKDPRTLKQQMADEWVKEHGPCDPMPK